MLLPILIITIIDKIISYLASIKKKFKLIHKNSYFHTKIHTSILKSIQNKTRLPYKKNHRNPYQKSIPLFLLLFFFFFFSSFLPSSLLGLHVEALKCETKNEIFLVSYSFILNFSFYCNRVLQLLTICISTLCYFYNSIPSSSIMTSISFLTNYKFVLVSCKIFGFLNFHVWHLNYEKFKLCLQNTLNMPKMIRVYFEVLQAYLILLIYLYVLYLFL